jgi:hypothetical protein
MIAHHKGHGALCTLSTQRPARAGRLILRRPDAGCGKPDHHVPRRTDPHGLTWNAIVTLVTVAPNSSVEHPHDEEVMVLALTDPARFPLESRSGALGRRFWPRNHSRIVTRGEVCCPALACTSIRCDRLSVKRKRPSASVRVCPAFTSVIKLRRYKVTSASATRYVDEPCHDP